MELEYRTYRLKKLLEIGVIRKIEKLTENSKYEVGKYYWCGYWGKCYKVIDVKYKKDGRLDYVDILWEDMGARFDYYNPNVRWGTGTPIRHSTPLDIRKDFLVTLNDENGEKDE